MSDFASQEYFDCVDVHDNIHLPAHLMSVEKLVSRQVFKLDMVDVSDSNCRRAAKVLGGKETTSGLWKAEVSVYEQLLSMALDPYWHQVRVLLVEIVKEEARMYCPLVSRKLISRTGRFQNGKQYYRIRPTGELHALEISQCQRRF